MKRLRILTLVAAILSGLLFVYRTSVEEPVIIKYSETIPDEWFESKGEILTPKKNRRRPDQTFLTFPEWFLVFTPEEQAVYLKNQTSTNYSYRAKMDQFWESYEIIRSHIEGKFPTNEEYYTMINVIGTSTEIEYDIRSWYETVIGRVTQTNKLSEEDQFNQRYTEEYAHFLNTAAWYEFDYQNQLNQIWGTTLVGWNLHRKIERKYMLTSEMLVKMAYAKLIKLGSSAMYGEGTLSSTLIVTDNLTPAMKQDSSIEVIQNFADSAFLISTPRYTPFTSAASKIALEGVNIIEVAGNKSAILISVIADSDKQIDKDLTRKLFSQSLDSDKKLSRIVLVTPINNLASFIRSCNKKKIKIEHIFDF
jgi:hypothetical protein